MTWWENTPKACSSAREIMANHESPQRPNRFVIQKIIQGVKAIAEGKQEMLVLANLDIRREWGWTPDYVEAMHRMLQAEQPMDYVIASGKTNSLRVLLMQTLPMQALILRIDWR